jgi:hypothetical protein
VDFLARALDALPHVAASPLAFTGYVFTLAAWIYAISRSQRLKTLLDRIKDVPPAERSRLIQLELGEVLPDKITPEQWIQSKKHRYFFAAFVLLLVTVLAIGAMAIWRGRAQLSIDDVQEVLPPAPRTSRPTGLVRLALASATDSDAPKVGFDRPATESLKYQYTFDITLRNPSEEPVAVTDVRVVFDPGTGSGLAAVQEISGTYVVRVDKTGAETQGPAGRFQAYAWYPSGAGRLIVKSPIAQTLKPKSVDRIRIVVEFPTDYSFRGKMERAVLEVLWNGNRHERSKTIILAKR